MLSLISGCQHRLYRLADYTRRLMLPGLAASIVFGCSAVAMAAESAADTRAETFQDWALHCETEQECVLQQRIFVEGMGDSPLVLVAFQAIAETPQPLTLIRVPLGVMVEPGLQVQIDAGDGRRIPFHHCRGDGCVALFPLPGELRQALEAGRKLRISFQRIDGQTIGVPVSLLGITAGLAALESRH